MTKPMRTKSELLKNLEDTILVFELDFGECVGVEVIFEDKSRYLWSGDKFKKVEENNENVK